MSPGRIENLSLIHLTSSPSGDERYRGRPRHWVPGCTNQPLGSLHHLVGTGETNVACARRFHTEYTPLTPGLDGRGISWEFCQDCWLQLKSMQYVLHHSEERGACRILVTWYAPRLKMGIRPRAPDSAFSPPPPKKEHGMAKYGHARSWPGGGDSGLKMPRLLLSALKVPFLQVVLLETAWSERQILRVRGQSPRP